MAREPFANVLAVEIGQRVLLRRRQVARIRRRELQPLKFLQQIFFSRLGKLAGTETAIRCGSNTDATVNGNDV